jgi:hypothetical protein
MTAVLDPPPAPTTATRVVRPPTPVRAKTRRHPWPLLAGFCAFALYATVGIWLMARGNFAIGDALVRNANSRVILFSRDPHLAALGMAWMPLPVLSQLPFQAIFHPLGVAWWSGPVSTAAYGGATVYVLARMAERLRVRRGLATVLVLLYAVSPVTIFWSGSGMSETCTFFFLVAGASLFLAWTERPDPWLLGGVGLMLGLATLSRYEMLFVAAAFAAGAAVMSTRGRRIRTAVVLVLPSMFVMFVWLAANRILLRDAFAWWHTLSALGRPPADAPWLPAERTPDAAARFVLDRALRFAPALLLVVPACLLADRRRVVAALTVLAGFSVTPLATGYFLLGNGTWGNVRYFVPLSVAAIVLSLWLVREASGSRHLALGLAVLLAVGAVAGSLAETTRNYAGVESEYIAMRDLLHMRPLTTGDAVKGSTPDTRILEGWKAVAKMVDGESHAHDLIAADTRHLSRFLITEDRDFEKQIQLSRPAFDMVLVGPDAAGSANNVLRATVSSPSRVGTWTKVGESFGLELWRLVPTPTDSNGSPVTGSSAVGVPAP